MFNGGGRFEVRYPDHGHHVEGDITHQVLALIDGDKVAAALPDELGQAVDARPCWATTASTARCPGPTRTGWSTRASSSAATPSTATSDVPTYPASHGCLRVPIPDAWSIYSWVQTGDRVDTYYRSGHHAQAQAVAQRRAVGPARARPAPRLDQRREQRGHAAARVGRALARRAVAIVEQAVDLVARRRRRGRRRPTRAISGTGRSAPSCQSVAARPSRAARKLDSISASRGVGTPGGASAARRASAWTSAGEAERRRAARTALSIARTSTVPSLGCGRRSHHMNV